MALDLLQKLKDWRSAIAQKEGVELYRVLPNKTIEAIATLKPKTKEDILAVKGIRKKKFEKYGIDILSLVNENPNKVMDHRINSNIKKEEKPYTVSNYLNLLNSEVRKHSGRIQGEVSSFDVRSNYLFFTLKDKQDESLLNCFMWNNNYQMSGIAIEKGMEIIIDGFPEIYKKTGKLSIQVSAIELVGEGALKKAYDELKKKLEKEGLFSKERKKPIPEFPQKIGLITSKEGAVIHDFLNNLGTYGYCTKFINSKVEGQIAVKDLISAIEYFNNQDIDILVIIRGGGSFESLQAFNNETLVRKISECKIPIICGIGHDKDAPLASLVADKDVSTPTAVTNILNKAWDNILRDLTVFERDIMYKYQEAITNTKYNLEELSNKIRKHFGFIFQKFNELKHSLKNALLGINYKIKDIRKTLKNLLDSLLKNFQKKIEKTNNSLDNIEKEIKILDPARQLKLGYSIASIDGKIIKRVKQVNSEDIVDIQVSDGKIKSKVDSTIN